MNGIEGGAGPWSGSPAVEAAYDELLRSVAARGSEIGERVTSHWPIFGRASKNGVLLVGQAVFGWVNDWDVAQAATPEGRRAILDETKTAMTNRDDHMDWVATNPYRTSPWWRAACHVVDQLTPGPEPWYSRLGWANLYPVAPGERKANPGGPLKEAQDPHVGRLLQAIVEAADPCVVVALVGPFWWPCTAIPELAALGEVARPLMRVGSVGGRPWVVGWHPGGAQRRHYSPEPYAKLIAAAVRGAASEGAR